MPEYCRAFVPGATFFFTVVTNFRKPILRSPRAVDALRSAFAHVRHRHRFEIDAVVILPDHLHCIWTMPPDDDDFSTRWRLIKGRFTRHYLEKGIVVKGQTVPGSATCKNLGVIRYKCQPRWDLARKDNGPV